MTGERAGGPSGCRKRLDLELAGGYVVGSFRKNSVTKTSRLKRHAVTHKTEKKETQNIKMTRSG